MARTGLTTDRVVEAAAELADDEGFEAVTTTALARRLGVRPPSLYSHVASTAALRAAVGVLALTETADLVAAAIAGRSGGEALLALADVHRDYARARPGRSQAMRHPVAGAPGGLAAGRRHADLTVAVLRGYDLPEAERVHAVRLVGAVLRGFVDLELATAFSHSDPAPEVSWGRALAALDVALRAWPDPPTGSPHEEQP